MKKALLDHITASKARIVSVHTVVDYFFPYASKEEKKAESCHAAGVFVDACKKMGYETEEIDWSQEGVTVSVIEKMM